MFLFIGKQKEENISPSITWEGDKSRWWLAGVVLAFLLVLSLVIFMLFRHLKPHTSNIADVSEDPESDSGEPSVSGSLLLLLYSQQNDEAIVQKVRKMKENLICSKYLLVIMFSSKLKVVLFE